MQEVTVSLICGNLVVEAELGDVGAVEVRGSITGREVIGIISVVEETKTARGIERMGPGVGELVVESVPVHLMQRDEQSIVMRPAESGPCHRIGAVAYERYAEIGVSTGIGVVRFGQQRWWFLLSDGGCLEAVAVDLAVDRALRSCDLWLVKGKRHGLMHPMVSAITHV